MKITRFIALLIIGFACSSPKESSQKENTTKERKKIDSFESTVPFIDFDKPTRCQFEFYLNHDSVSIEAKEFWEEKRKPSDDFATSKVLDELNSKPIEVIPFYFIIATKIMNQTDGGLSELTTHAAHKFVFEEHTEDFFAFINKEHCFITKANFSVTNWAIQLGAIISMSCDEQENYENCTVRKLKSLKEKCPDCDTSYFERRVKNWI